MNIYIKQNTREMEYVSFVLHNFLIGSNNRAYPLEGFNMIDIISKIKNKIENLCPICLYNCISPSRTNSCMHIFCNKCIKIWANVNKVCPICRRALIILLKLNNIHALY